MYPSPDTQTVTSEVTRLNYLLSLRETVVSSGEWSLTDSESPLSPIMVGGGGWGGGGGGEG